MTTLDDVYRKFGEASETAQLLETELGNMLFFFGIAEENLFVAPDAKRATEILKDINRRTLGQLLKRLNSKLASLDELGEVLEKALQERNRLAHSFYRQHNFRRNSVEGRALMLEDLQQIHSALLDAYTAALELCGCNVESVPSLVLPTTHVPI